MKKYIIQTLFLLAAVLVVQVEAKAQNEVSKKEESFNVDEDVLIDLNTKRTQVIFETWNRDEVEVKAKITSDELSEEELKNLSEAWQLDVMGNSRKISIASNGNDAGFGNLTIKGNAISSVNKEMIQPLMENMIGPFLQQMDVPPFS